MKRACRIEMLSVVTGLPDDIGDEMVTNEHIELITFTGGVRVGKLIAQKAATSAPSWNWAVTIR